MRSIESRRLLARRLGGARHPLRHLRLPPHPRRRPQAHRRRPRRPPQRPRARRRPAKLRRRPRRHSPGLARRPHRRARHRDIRRPVHGRRTRRGHRRRRMGPVFRLRRHGRPARQRRPRRPAVDLHLPLVRPPPRHRPSPHQLRPIRRRHHLAHFVRTRHRALGLAPDRLGLCRRRRPGHRPTGADLPSPAADHPHRRPPRGRTRRRRPRPRPAPQHSARPVECCDLPVLRAHGPAQRPPRQLLHRPRHLRHPRRRHALRPARQRLRQPPVLGLARRPHRRPARHPPRLRLPGDHPGPVPRHPGRDGSVRRLRRLWPRLRRHRAQLHPRRPLAIPQQRGLVAHPGHDVRRPARHGRRRLDGRPDLRRLRHLPAVLRHRRALQHRQPRRHRLPRHPPAKTRHRLAAA